MSKQARDLFQAGKLTEAIETLSAHVRSKPLDLEARGLLADLLCLAGVPQRADAQLDAISHQDPQLAVPVALIRQLVRAETWRQDFHAEGRVPELLDSPPGHLRLHLEASVLIREGKPAEAAAKLAEAEEMRPHVAGEADGRRFDDFRDADDLTASFFEVLTSTGKYFWIPIEQVETVDFQPPSRPRDLLWRQAHMVVEGGPDGEVYLPAIYALPGAAWSDADRLGRATDWSGGDGTPVRGIGQRTFLAGEEALPILAITSLSFGG